MEALMEADMERLYKDTTFDIQIQRIEKLKDSIDDFIERYISYSEYEVGYLEPKGNYRLYNFHLERIQNRINAKYKELAEYLIFSSVEYDPHRDVIDKELSTLDSAIRKFRREREKVFIGINKVKSLLDHADESLEDAYVKRITGYLDYFCRAFTTIEESIVSLQKSKRMVTAWKANDSSSLDSVRKDYDEGSDPIWLIAGIKEGYLKKTETDGILSWMRKKGEIDGFYNIFRPTPTKKEFCEKLIDSDGNMISYGSSRSNIIPYSEKENKRLISYKED